MNICTGKFAAIFFVLHSLSLIHIYHFEDIPGLFRWILEQGSKKMLEKARSQNGAEDAIRYFILVAINARPYIEKSIPVSYTHLDVYKRQYIIPMKLCNHLIILSE